MLPAGVLKRFQVVIDYLQRTLALAQPGPLKAEGLAVPFHINPKTGLIARRRIDRRHVLSSDDRQRLGVYVVQPQRGDAMARVASRLGARRRCGWREQHDDVRGPHETGRHADAGPRNSVGSLVLKDVGVLAAGAGRSPLPDVGFLQLVLAEKCVPVIGWIGGNVLQQFRLTIDYPDRMTYWLEERGPESHDLDQVGLTLQSERGAYIVAAVATRTEKPTVEGILPGDKLVRVGDLELANATWGAIYNAMHGAPADNGNARSARHSADRCCQGHRLLTRRSRRGRRS